MSDRLKIWIVYGISALFIIFNTYLLVQEKYWGLVAPLLLLMLVLYLFSLDRVLLLITFLTPLAVNLKNDEFGFGLSLPTEPLMAIVLVMFIIKIFYDGYREREVIRHPVTITILINLIWIGITCITSEYPMVSLKFMVARLWFLIPFYFMGVLLFKDFRNIRKFQWYYVIPLLFVIVYTLFNHAQWGFTKPTSNMVMHPFYNDHTAYGAVISMFLPIFVGFALSRIYPRHYRMIAMITVSVMVVGLIFSYSRAAWVSVAAALAIYLIIFFRIRFQWVLLGTIVLVGLFLVFRFQFMDKLEKNKQDSSTDFLEHVQSISNISSDASNLERINRWNSAWRMFVERPVFGWGPGTYQFAYAPFQRSKDRTIISTNYGDMGNAHSEYFGPLSESGVLGMLTFIAIIIAVLITAMRVYRRAKNKEVRFISLMLMLGLCTYYIHGFLNNFLDTDKSSVPFWGFTAAIVALDVFFMNREEVPPVGKKKSQPKQIES